MPSWLHTFASACLSGRCCSPGTASCLADSQRLTGYLVYPEGLPVQLDPSSIPSYSFHGAHMECTTGLTAQHVRLRAPLHGGVEGGRDEHQNEHGCFSFLPRELCSIMPSLACLGGCATGGKPHRSCRGARRCTWPLRRPRRW